MKKNGLIALFVMLFFLGSAGECAAAPELKFKLTIYRGKSVMLTCVITGQDENNDGILEASELISFNETEDYAVSESTRGTGWRAYVDVNKMPMLSHGIKDIQVFQFDLQDFKNGLIKIEYRTKTNNNFKFGSYLFWRIVEIDENDSLIRFIHGKDDGTQGLSSTRSWTNYDTKELTMKITAQ